MAGADAPAVFHHCVRYDLDAEEKWHDLEKVAYRLLEGAGEDHPEPKWTSRGCEFVGRRLSRVVGGKTYGATVICWLPALEGDAAEPALYKVRHDDGDVEDLELRELVEELEPVAPPEARGQD